MLAGGADRLWGVRVLAQSLRESGSRGDVVVVLAGPQSVDRRVRELLAAEVL